MPTKLNCKTCKQSLPDPDPIGGIYYFVCPACGTVREVPQDRFVTDVQAQLDLFESEYRVVLPDALKAYLRSGADHNLSYELAVDAALARYADDGMLQIHGFLSLDPLEGMSMFSTRKLIAEWDLPGDIVLLSGDGHTWLALDYRNTQIEPPVIFIESETGRTEAIAPSFDDFLRRLKQSE